MSGEEGEGAVKPPGADGARAGAPRAKAAQAGMGDLVRLGMRMAGARLRPGGTRDMGAVGCRWARELMEEAGARGLDVGLAGRSVHVVGHAAPSERILSDAPHEPGAPAPGALKKEAMAFLAPGALTVAHGEAWARLRGFNERVLAPGGLHPLADAFLPVVRGAFAEPVTDPEGVREAMGRAMVGIVLGEVEPGADPAADVRVLFDVVQSPVRRKLLGFLYAGRRRRLFELLGRVYDASDDGRPTLVGRARRDAGDRSRDEVLQQVPHWMFTFTGSGSDLLFRTLALVTARPGALERVRDEITAAGPADAAATVEGLEYLEACLREAGRLFPPVTRTFHRLDEGDGEGDTVHYFPLLQRDPELGASVHAFRPERWLEPEPDRPARASNLFLRGPRACPGEDLILFVCKAALARLLGELGVEGEPSRLSRDPLPVSFPDEEARLTAPGRRPQGDR